MTFRFLMATLALTTAATTSDAGPLRRRAQPVYQAPSYVQPSVTPVGGYTTGYTPVVVAEAASPAAGTWAGGGDGLDEVNAKRAARGLRPFLRDEGLTHAAQACASFRAGRGLFGHTSNDFGFLPPGATASAAGCAAYPASYGWMSCCTYDNATYAGAAWATGADGKRYMHLFVR